jgi:hypothetical protein
MAVYQLLTSIAYGRIPSPSFILPTRLTQAQQTLWQTTQSKVFSCDLAPPNSRMWGVLPWRVLPRRVLPPANPSPFGGGQYSWRVLPRRVSPPLDPSPFGCGKYSSGECFPCEYSPPNPHLLDVGSAPSTSPPERSPFGGGECSLDECSLYPSV